MLGVNHEALVSLAEKRFSGLSSNKHVEVAPCWYTGSEVCLVCLLSYFAVCIVSMYLFYRSGSVMMTCHMPMLCLLWR